MNTNTCILFFSHSASFESGRKTLFPSKVRNAQLAEVLVKNTKDVISKANLPWSQFDENAQRGKTFGERISFAVDDLFQKGFQNVIVVGNDCPDLNTGELMSAARLLRSGHQILGKDLRGGAYLIGISKKHWNLATFACLPWQTKNLAQSLKQLFFGQGLFFETRSKSDINSSAELVDWLTDSQGNLADAIRLLFQSGPTSFLQVVQKILSSFKLKSSPFRGPPSE